MKKTFVPARPVENLTASQKEGRPKTQGSVCAGLAAALLFLTLCACGGESAPAPEPTPTAARETPVLIWTEPKETPPVEKTPLPE